MKYFLDQEELDALRKGKAERVVDLVGAVYDALRDAWSEAAGPHNAHLQFRRFEEWEPVKIVKKAYQEFCDLEKIKPAAEVPKGAAT